MTNISRTGCRAAPIPGIVLASGLSRRFGPSNKLLADLHGVPVVSRTVTAYIAAGLSPVLVVVGYQAEHVRLALSGLSVRFVVNPDFEQGQSRALARGVGALADDAPAAVIGVGDQPYLTGSAVQQLVGAHLATGGPIVAPRYAGRRGNPVLFDRSLFPELLEVVGDQGGRPVLKRHSGEIVWVDIPDASQGVDLDTVEDLRRLQERPEL